MAQFSTGAGGARRWLTSYLMEGVNSTVGVGRRDKIIHLFSLSYNVEYARSGL